MTEGQSERGRERERERGLMRGFRIVWQRVSMISAFGMFGSVEKEKGKYNNLGKSDYERTRAY